MPLQETSGAASYDAFGGGTPVPANYIEDVFSTFLYTGNGSTQTITNGIALATNGGLVWLKSRSAATNNFLFDTNRGALNELNSNTTDAQASLANSLTSFNSNGFSIGNATGINVNAATYTSWSFQKQPKFFDVVTWTGDGTGTRVISHNLTSTPGCIFLKRLDSTDGWWVVHRSGANGFSSYAKLETTAAFVATGSTVSGVNDTSFTIGSFYNNSGSSWVAYVFAHNAGGFGDSGTDNVISCGSYTGNGNNAGPVVDLGYEPQWIMIKNRTGTGNWQIVDSMRGIYFSYNEATLQANLIDAETAGNFIRPLANGFRLNTTSTEFNTSASVYIYIAIRRGPMKTPTDGSAVFGLNNRTGTGANATVTGLPVTDAVLIKNTGSAVDDLFASRLNGSGYSVTSSTAAELLAGTTILQSNAWDVMNGIEVGTTSTITNASSNTFINYLFRRAPKFMDVAYYLGTGAVVNQPHNLNAVPELMIVKQRDAVTSWVVYYGNNANYLRLNTNDTPIASTVMWNTTTPTSEVFTLGTNTIVNLNGGSYFAWLFASCPSVSKIGTFTGTAATQVIDCGFTSGARFVLIKSTSAVGDWYVWDSARGIVAGNDPYFLINSNAAQVTNTDWVDTAASGFELTNTAGNLANSSGVSYVFLAIA